MTERTRDREEREWGQDDLTPIEGLPAGHLRLSLAESLRLGLCPSDRLFDRFLRDDVRAASAMYWTPLAAAARAAEWFEEFGIRTVVDIGSGAGKFCVAAALASNCEFIGLEQRPRLVAAARELARLFQCDGRVRFCEAEFGVDPAPRADAYYLYNPFGENLFGYQDHLDDDVELSEERFARDVSALRALLHSAPRGTYVLTYNGFCAPLPATFHEVRTDRELPNVLRLSRKVDGEDG